MNGLPRKKARPVPNSIMAMPMAMSFTLRQLADIAMDGAEQRAGDPGGQHAQPGRAGEVGDGVAGHGAEDQRAFEAEIDASRFLRQALAEADEEEGRRDADGAREHGEQNDAKARIPVIACPPCCGRSGSGRRACRRPAARRTSGPAAPDGGVGQAHAPLDQAAGRGDAAEEDGTGMMASGFCLARNATRMPVKP